jgi:hypothetical protein
MIKKKGKPITGTNTDMAPKAPVLGNAATPSADAQKLLTRPPMPFSNKNSMAQSKPAAKAPGGVSTLEPKIQSGLKRSSAGQNPLGSPVGYNKLPNQSGQIGGRNGFPPPRRKAGNNAFQKVKKGAAFFGE